MSSLSTFYNFPLSQPSLHGAAGTALTDFRSPETDSRKIPDNPTQDKRRKGRFRRGLSSPFQNHTGSSEKASLRAAPSPSSPPSGGPSDSGCGADPPLPRRYGTPWTYGFFLLCLSSDAASPPVLSKRKAASADLPRPAEELSFSSGRSKNPDRICPASGLLFLPEKNSGESAPKGLTRRFLVLCSFVQNIAAGDVCFIEQEKEETCPVPDIAAMSAPRLR